MRKCMAVIVVILIASCGNFSTREVNSLYFEDNIDTTVNPADDFFSYANGKWLRNNAIPEDESSWGIGNLIENEIYNRMWEINIFAANYTGNDPIQQKVGNFWRAAMDSITIERQGLDYLRFYLDGISMVKDLTSFQGAMAMLQRIGVKVLVDPFVAQDEMNSSRHALYLHQGGLGMPDREYYFRSDSATAYIRQAYVKHIGNVLILLGREKDSARKAAQSVYTFETRLAMFSKKIEEMRNPYENYNKVSFAGLNAMSETVKWGKFLSDIGVHALDSIVVGQPDFIRSLDNSLKATDTKTLRDYLSFHLVTTFTEALPVRFGVESFSYSKNLSGASQQKPRWKRTYLQEERVMGEMLGQLYVKRYFSEASKIRYEEMATEVKEAFRNRIKHLDWMSQTTKNKALAKLDAMKLKIGYPDKWKDFSSMIITGESYLQNLINAKKWHHQYEFDQLNKPIDKDDWEMTPQTYNAYYHPVMNEMVFPAAAFVIPGYKDSDLDEAMMYGYSGASFFGHEITHGFDDQGRLYGADGNLSNWWTSGDSASFAQRAKLIIEQFNSYEPVAGYHINGEATQGENIADLGGVEIGIDAFKKSKAYRDNKVIDGFTPIQRFFLGYALSWMYKTRPEALRSQLMTDVHSPARYRVNGPLGNIEDFYETYKVQQHDSMYIPPTKRVKIW